MLIGSKLQCSSGHAVQLRQIFLVGVGGVVLVQDSLADGFEECPGDRDRSLRVGAATRERLFPDGVDAVGVEGLKGS